MIFQKSYFKRISK